MKWLLTPFLFFACTPQPQASPARSERVLPAAPADAGPLVNEQRLASWLQWQRALTQLGPATGDYKKRAKQEEVLLADAGLTSAQADAIEAVVAAVVAERTLAKLSGEQAIQQFRKRVEQLGPEQRLKAEEALLETHPRVHSPSLILLEERFGVEAVRVVLASEAEVTVLWDGLMLPGTQSP